jgi:hypothetical protein
MSNAVEEIMNGAYVDQYLIDTVPSEPGLQDDKSGTAVQVCISWNKKFLPF